MLHVKDLESTPGTNTYPYTLLLQKSMGLDENRSRDPEKILLSLLTGLAIWGYLAFPTTLDGRLHYWLV